jgi:hypothetical protein
MKNIKIHRVDKATRREGELLAARLNADTAGQEQDEIKNFLQQFAELTRDAEQKDQLNASTERRHNRKMQIDSMNEVLRRYPRIVQLVHIGKDGPTFFEAFYDVRDTGSEAHSQMRAILLLARMGLINRMRKCDRCGEWLFAGLPKSRFCGRKCQQAKWHTLPEVRKKDREKQREYYRKHLSPRTGIEMRKKSRKRTGR